MSYGEKNLNYISRARLLANTLKSMDAHVDDMEIAMTILNGLSEQYNDIIVLCTWCLNNHLRCRRTQFNMTGRAASARVVELA